jgi:hypothetical protein|tara:strand:+ start:1849 stop:2217 length:369 start_codon:yes stop_codon:yes gene_type:complete
MIQAFIGPLTNLAGTWLNNRAQKAQIKQRIQVAKLEAKVKKIETDGDWELEQAKASQDSWKDELWTVFFVILLSACFYPPAQPYIEDGFRFLREDLPEWLSWSIMASIAASFGLKSIGKIRG